MELGFGVPVAGAWATPANQVRVARRAEELGYRSLWTFQRLVVPEVPDERSGAPFYQQVQDAVVPLAFLAGQSSWPPWTSSPGGASTSGWGSAGPGPSTRRWGHRSSGGGPGRRSSWLPC